MTGEVAPSGREEASLESPGALPWMQDEAAAFARARSEGKGVMIDFYAAWCAPCEELDRWLATPDAIAAIAPRFVALRFDVTEDSDQAARRRQRYRADTLPALVFVDAGGQVLERVSQLREPAELLGVARGAASRLRPDR